MDKYRIASGDTLSEIARRNNTTVQALLEANPDITNQNVIIAGRELKLAPRDRFSGGGQGPVNLTGGTPTVEGGSPVTNSSGGPTPEILAELERGFREAGRDDLADMVNTPEFAAWVAQESSWDPSAVSPANNQGLANGGLFQVWFGHDVRADQMSPADQAKLVAELFPHLTPEAIRGYASEIASGSYQGWG